MILQLLLSAFGLLVYRVRRLGRILCNGFLLTTLHLPSICMLMGHDFFGSGILDSTTSPSTAIYRIQASQPTIPARALNDAAYERAKKLPEEAMNLEAEAAYWGFTDIEEVVSRADKFTTHMVEVMGMEQARLGKPEAEKTSRFAEGGENLAGRIMDVIEATLMKGYEMPGGKNIWVDLADFVEC